MYVNFSVSGPTCFIMIRISFWPTVFSQCHFPSKVDKTSAFLTVVTRTFRCKMLTVTLVILVEARLVNYYNKGLMVELHDFLNMQPQQKISTAVKENLKKAGAKRNIK